GSGQGTEHHRRKVLTLVDHDMSVAPLALVVLELLQHSLREIIPVVIFPLEGTELSVALVELKHRWAIGPCDSCTGSPDTIRLDVIVLGLDTMLCEPAELLQEE